MTDREKAFNKIMGDPSMPADAGPDYDEWLFNKTWEAAKSEHQPTESVSLKKCVDAFENKMDCDGVLWNKEQCIEAVLDAAGVPYGD